MRFGFTVLAALCVVGAQAQSLYVTTTDGISKYAPNGTSTVFASGLTSNGPERMTFDASGNLYMSAVYTGEVDKFTPDGHRTIYASGIPIPMGLAFDASGNLYTTSNYSNIVKITPTGAVSTVVSGITNPFDLTFDSAGNMYYTSTTGLYKRTPTGTISTIASVPGLPGGNFVGLAMDKSGNFYLGDYNNHSIQKVTAGGLVSTFATLSYSPEGMAIDNSGNLFAIEYNAGSSRILEYDPLGNMSVFATGLSYPEGLAFYSPAETSTPEPGALAALAGALIASGTMLRRRRSTGK